MTQTSTPRSAPHVAVRISDDGMRAMLCLVAKSPTEVSPPLKELEAQVLDLATQARLAVPIATSTIHRILYEWLRTGRATEVVIGRGQPPRHGTDAQVTLHRPKPRHENLSSRDRIEKRNRGYITNITRGTLLATVVPATTGTPGRAVTGAEVLPSPGKPHQILTSALVCVTASNDRITYTAGADAILAELSDSKIDVTHQIEVRRSVDHETGSLDVWGSVVVRGSVNPGFSVRATGNIEVDGLCDSAYLESGGSVTIRGGVLGRTGVTEVRAKHDFSAYFVENAMIEAGARVIVRDSVINSRIRARESISVGGKGIVLSSLLAAERSIVASEFGSEAVLPLELSVGSDPLTWQQVERLRRELLALHRKSMKGILASARERDHTVSRQLDLNAKRRRMAFVLERIAHRKHQALVSTIDQGEIRASRAIHPRTRIRIGPHTLVVTQVLEGGVLRLDSSGTTIVWSRK